MKKMIVKSAPGLSCAFAALATLCAGNALAQPAEGNWMLRVRTLHMQPADKSSDPTGTLGNNSIHVASKTFPEVDISYFFTRHLAAELILTYPQRHDVTLNGNRIGSFKHLPPTLTLQYHFLPDSTFRPYVGAGINYTRLSNVNLLGGAATLDRNSWGAALQAGFDVKVGSNSYLNFDVKKVYIESDVSLNGAKVSTVKVDPWLIGVGYGMKF